MDSSTPVLQAPKLCIFLLYGSYTLRCFELILRMFKMCISSDVQTYKFLHVDILFMAMKHVGTKNNVTNHTPFLSDALTQLDRQRRKH